MNPIIKWAGGKEKELPYIMKALPKEFDRYVEPFVGGGSVYFNLNINNSIINDKSDELIGLYNRIQKRDEKFIQNLNNINKDWIKIESIIEKNYSELKDIYSLYCECFEKKDELEAKAFLKNKADYFIKNHKKELEEVISNDFNIDVDNFIFETKKNLISKMSRMNSIEKKKGKLSEKDLYDNIECAFKSAYYMHFRNLYNHPEKYENDKSLYTAIFYFVREFCYASMFRYNADGKFNVPYGGISYNRKDFTKKINYLSSNKLTDYMSNTKIYCNDFEKFMNEIKLKKTDFIFLDPPYDTEFSTYAMNEFNKSDQVRLAEFLKNTEAKFMLIIKNTDFIYNLYNDPKFKIQVFDKNYLVSFQNRNDKKVEHLLITNY